MPVRYFGYLLDTNHLAAYFGQDAKFLARLNSQTPERRIFWASAISLGEIEAGYKMTNHDPTVAARFRAFLAKEFVQHLNGDNFILPIDEHTKDCYAEIVGRICGKHPDRKPKQRTEAFLNQHGVDINDVWIFATAWKHNLTLLTEDAMVPIRGVVTQAEVTVDNWL